VTPAATSQEPSTRSVAEQIGQMRREITEAGGSRRRSRMDDLEDMMMMEAIRLSLAAEEERKKKAEKDAQKDAKKKAKDDKKKEKREKKGVYGSGQSSASGSALSLALPGIGRRRGNSGGSNLAREVTPEDADISSSKGKSVDRGVVASPTASAPIDFTRPSGSPGSGIPGARHLDSNALSNILDSNQRSASPTVPDRPSHLRQMSNASSPASSYIESVPGSLRNGFHGHGSSSSLDSPNTSGTNIAGHTGSTPEGGDGSGNAGSEPMFNFRSLAAMIGDEEGENKDISRHIDHLENYGSGGGESSKNGISEGSTNTPLEESVATLRVDVSNTGATDPEERRQKTILEPQWSTPEVMVTPVTPAALSSRDDDGKQLGAAWSHERCGTREITQ